MRLQTTLYKRRFYLHVQQVQSNPRGALHSAWHVAMATINATEGKEGKLTLNLRDAACHSAISGYPKLSSSAKPRSHWVLALQSALLQLLGDCCKLDFRCSRLLAHCSKGHICLVRPGAPPLLCFCQTSQVLCTTFYKSTLVLPFLNHSYCARLSTILRYFCCSAINLTAHNFEQVPLCSNRALQQRWQRKSVACYRWEQGNRWDRLSWTLRSSQLRRKSHKSLLFNNGFRPL